MEDEISPNDLMEYLYNSIDDLEELPKGLVASAIAGKKLTAVQPDGAYQINVDENWIEIIESVRKYVATIAAVVSAYVGLVKIGQKKLTEDELIAAMRADDAVKLASQKLSDNELRDIIRFVKSKVS